MLLDLARVSQHAPLAAQTPTFRTAIEVVRIDAAVLDAKREPIRGLTAADFTVLEDGQPRPIVAFDAVDIPDPPPPAPNEAAWVRSAPRDVISNRVDERRIFLIVMDDASMPLDARMIESAKKIGADVVSRMSDSDRAAVVFTADARGAQDFTADRSRLLAAIGSMSGGHVLSSPPDTAGMSDPMFYKGAITTIGQSIDALMRTPQGRKTLVLVSVGIPQDPSANEPRAITGQASIGGREAQMALRDDLSRAFQRASLGHVTIYAFDPSGLGMLEDYVTAYHTRNGSQVSAAMQQASDYAKRARDFLLVEAESTGGRAIIGASDPVAGVTQMFRESSAYYLIGFQSGSDKPGHHRLDIRTTRPGATVQTRGSFDTEKPARPNTARPVDPIARAITGVLPEGNLPMRVSVVPLAAPSGKDGIAAITLGIHQPSSLESTIEKVDVQITAYKDDGKPAASTRLNAQLKLRASAAGSVQYEVLAQLPLKPGHYQLRIAADIASRNAEGSVFADIDMPDFTKGLSMSGLALAMTPAPAFAPANAFASLLPLVPTSHRDFAGSERVSLFARIYQAGKQPPTPVNMTVRVVDARDRRVFSRTETMAAPPAPSRSVDYPFEIPVSTIDRGDYLVTVEARTAGGTAVRTVRFTRR